MKLHGSSIGGGVARDVEPAQCRLAGKVLLGSIVVIDGSKSEKNEHKRKQETKGRTKTGGGKKMAIAGI